jgi:hypothetical protein
VIQNPGLHGFSHLPFQGSKYALLRNYPGAATMGLVGALSPRTNVGSTYVLSAEVATDKAALDVPTFDVRLRNSTTGAQSAPVVQAAVAHATTWTRLTGTVTTNAQFDQVVLRHSFQPGGAGGTRHGLIDDVQLCELAVALPEHPAGWWTTARLVGAAVLGGLLVIGLGLGGRRRFRTRGRNSSATVRG